MTTPRAMRFSVRRRRAVPALAGALLLAAAGLAAPGGAAAQGGGDAGGSHRGRTMVGVFVGHDLPALREFEGFLGRKVDGVLEYTSDRAQSELGPSDRLSGPLGGTGRGIFWSMPHHVSWGTPDDGLANLRQVASGARDADFVRWGRELIARGTPVSDGNFYIRPAWEVPGEWFPWGRTASKDPAAFKAAFCRFAKAIRSVSNRIKVVWDFNSDRGPIEHLYPGDDCVDVISQDIYWTPSLQGRDPKAAFERHLTGYSRGLAWMAEFAAARGKPMAISEFGVNPSVRGAEVWLELFADWVRSHNVVYVVYWYSDADFSGRFSGNRKVAETFRRLFGQQRQR